MPSIFCGTYAKYNSGNLDGVWIDLSTCADKQEFMQKCYDYHKDEGDAELMFCDHEGIPDFFIGESYLSDDIWSYMNCSTDDEVKKAYVEARDRWDEEDCESSYIGQFRSFTKLAEYLVDEQVTPSEIPEHLQYYFDYEAYGRDIRLNGDVVEENGHFFWNH